jgi:ribose 5-phosphate isomerase A
MKSDNGIIDTLEWGKDISRKEEKDKVAARLASMVKDGDRIGAGSGSTSYLALLQIAKRVRDEGIKISAIPTSIEISMTCLKLGIPMSSLESGAPDWCFDGADEIDPNKSLIKGRGGAMFREKLLMRSAPVTYILADSSKMVNNLGEKFPIPIEIYPQALTYVCRALKDKLPIKDLRLRMAGQGKDGPVVTEGGNLIIDAWMNTIPSTAEKEIKCITGVVESGLFIGYPVEILVV